MRRLVKILTLSLLAMVAASCGCTKKRTLPDVDPSTFDRYTQNLKFNSGILKEEVRYSVYLPASYIADKEKRYPVVYMLHGYGDNNNSWSDSMSSIGTAEANGTGEMIYVYPRAFNSYYCNFYDGSYNYMDMFVQELIPHIDATLRTIPDKQHRFITGYSMGGWGAMVMAIKNPDLFCASAPLSMSFRTDEMYMTESKDGWNSQWGTIFGGYGTTGEARLTPYYKAHCPLYVFAEPGKKELSTVHWFLTCGDDEERLLIANDTLHVVMRDCGYEHEFRVADGAHTSSYWRSALMEVLPMFWYYSQGGTKWPGKAMDTPQGNNCSFQSDGTLKSDAYTTDGSGNAIYLFYDGLQGGILKDAMSILHRNFAESKYVILPCDLSQKNIDEWITAWSHTYPAQKMTGVAFGMAGRALFANKASFYKNIFINASVATDPTGLTVSSDDKLYYICTDGFAWYRDMDILYHACKKASCRYEYRVIKSSGETANDILRCTDIAKSFISY